MTFSKLYFPIWLSKIVAKTWNGIIRLSVLETSSNLHFQKSLNEFENNFSNWKKNYCIIFFSSFFENLSNLKVWILNLTKIKGCVTWLDIVASNRNCSSFVSFPIAFIIHSEPIGNSIFVKSNFYYIQSNTLKKTREWIKLQKSYVLHKLWAIYQNWRSEKKNAAQLFAGSAGLIPRQWNEFQRLKDRNFAPLWPTQTCSITLVGAKTP